jgi:hypothetical protein
MRPLQLSLFTASLHAEAPREAPPPEPQRALIVTAPSVEQPRRIAPPWTPGGLTDEARLAARLSGLLRERVEVELTDNSWTMVSWRRRDGLLLFRLHHMFGSAPEPVVRAIAGFTGRSRRAAGRVIDDHIRSHRHLIKAREARPEPEVDPRGDVYDLLQLYQGLNAVHFNSTVEARIGWGRRAPGRRRRSIKMGVYFHERRLIKIHPALDDARVPRLFVEAVVFHEMLHQVIPPTVDEGGRRCVHSAAFRAAERAFPGYERARAWEKANLGLLLRHRP